MNWKRSGWMRLLGCAVLVALAIVLVALGIRYRAGRDAAVPEPEAKPEITALGEYTAMTYTANSITLTFTRKENGGWLWADDPDFPLDDTAVRNIARLCTDLKPQQALTDVEELEGYGMDDPAAVLNITDDTGKVMTLTFGNPTTDGMSRYMTESGRADVLYVVDGALYEALCMPVYEMYALPELPELSAATLESVTLAGTGENGGAITVLTVQRTEGTDSITWRSNGANVTDDLRVQALMSDLRALKAERCVDYKPSQEAAELCGFGAPEAILTAVYTAEDGSEDSFSITVGAPLPDWSGRYVRFSGSDTIFLLSEEALDPMMQLAVEGLE